MPSHQQVSTFPKILRSLSVGFCHLFLWPIVPYAPSDRFGYRLPFAIWSESYEFRLVTPLQEMTRLISMAAMTS
jgi:hypothetical protein